MTTQPNDTVTPDASYNFFQADTTTARPGVFILGAGYINPSNNPAKTTLYPVSADGFFNPRATPSGSFANGVAVVRSGYLLWAASASARPCSAQPINT